MKTSQASFGTTNTLTIREARAGLSHPAKMFADHNEVLVVCRGKRGARILPVTLKRKIRSLADFRAKQKMQAIPSEVLSRENRNSGGF